MGTTADKLNHLINTKEGIRQEINRAYNAEEIGTSDTFNSYIQKLEEHPFYLKKLIEGTVESIKLHNVTSIGTRTFQGCINLTNASFPSATSIGDGAFSDCSSLTSVLFPKVTIIGTAAFNYCSNLNEVSFPSATSIGDGAFSDCSNLTSASFPNVTSMGLAAFQNCSNLTTIYVGTNTSTVCTMPRFAPVFINCTNLINIYVPASLVDSYKSATGWSDYASKIKAAP